MFNDMVGCIVHDLISHELDAYFTEDEVDTISRRLPSGKSPSWDGFTNEVFKRYLNILKGAFTLMFTTLLGFFSCMPQAWKVGLIKLVPTVASPESFHQWKPISLMEGLYNIFTKVLTNRLQKYLPKLIHPAQWFYCR